MSRVTIDTLLCAAILRDKSIDLLTSNEVQDQYLKGAGRLIFSYLRNHFSIHGKLPKTDTIAHELGIEEREILSLLQEPIEPTAYYVELVRDRAASTIIESSQKKLSGLLHDGKIKNAKTQVKELYEQLLQMEATGTGADSFIDWGEDAEKRREAYLQAEALGTSVTGLGFPWEILNEKTSGMNPGNLVVIVSSTGVGKTFFLSIMGIDLFFQHRPGKPKTKDNRVVALLITEEMTAREIAVRLDSIYCGLSCRNIRAGSLTLEPGGGKELYLSSLTEISDKGKKRIWIADAGSCRTVTDIEILAARTKPDIILVDSFYELESWMGSKDRKKWERVADVSQQIKAMAIRRKIPIVLTSQFNREYEKRLDSQKRKGKVKLRGSAADAGFSYEIFQRADIGIGIRAEQESLMVDKEMLIYLVKNRHGDAGLAFRCNWDLDEANFEFIEEVVDKPKSGGGEEIPEPKAEYDE